MDFNSLRGMTAEINFNMFKKKNNYQAKNTPKFLQIVKGEIWCEI